MGLSAIIHLWSTDLDGRAVTACGRKITQRTNVVYTSTAEKLKLPGAEVCKVCAVKCEYRYIYYGPPRLVK